MPAKNRVKTYVKEGYYHIYNRGVEKRRIFIDEQDYNVFLSYLKEYLLPKNEDELRERLSNYDISYKDKNKILKQLRLNNFAGEITFLAYCLMPNHFHFFIKQNNALSIDKFMQSLCTRYTMYFNRKYKRIGFLYQDIYKAALVTNDSQYIYLSKYIHKQALASQGPTLQGGQGQPSSYLNYLGIKQTEWVHPEEILAHFSKITPASSYQVFVEEKEDFHGDIQNLILDED